MTRLLKISFLIDGILYDFLAVPSLLHAHILQRFPRGLFDCSLCPSRQACRVSSVSQTAHSLGFLPSAHDVDVRVNNVSVCQNCDCPVPPVPSRCRLRRLVIHRKDSSTRNLLARPTRTVPFVDTLDRMRPRSRRHHYFVSCFCVDVSVRHDLTANGTTLHAGASESIQPRQRRRRYYDRPKRTAQSLPLASQPRHHKAQSADAHPPRFPHWQLFHAHSFSCVCGWRGNSHGEQQQHRGHTKQRVPGHVQHCI